MGVENVTYNEIHGEIPAAKFYSTESEFEKVVCDFISRIKDEEVALEDVVILTARTEDSSWIDINKKASMSALVNPENRRLLYTGTSRAKNLLNIAMLEDVETGEYGDYLRTIAPGRNVPRNKKGLKRLFNITV